MPWSPVRSIETLRSVLRFRTIEGDAAERRLRRAASVADLRAIAYRRLPRGVFDYIDGGAEGEMSMRRNIEAFDRVEFRPRAFTDVAEIDTSAVVLGQTLPIPVVLAPTGFTRMVCPNGELDVARAAASARIPYTISTMATRSIEEVAAVSDGPKWFQVYVWKDRGLVKELLERAAHAQYEAIVLTIDTAVLGRRERDIRRGFTLPPQIGLETLIDGLLHPGWTWSFVRAEPIVFANVGTDGARGNMATDLAAYVASQFDPSLSWDDLDWLRTTWRGPIVVKGIQRVEDALRAADSGVDAIAVSNHGGRQLDGAPPVLELVEPVSSALGNKVQILCDGGVRRGSDVIKAVALGATACMVGRAYLYGLGVAGERGVTTVIRWLDGGIRTTMALTGCRTIAEVTRDLVQWRSEH